MKGSGRGFRAAIVWVVFAAVALALAVPQCGLAEEPAVESKEMMEGVSGAAAGAAAAAGPRAIQPITYDAVITTGAVAAGTGAMIVAGGEMITISAGIAAAVVLGVALSGKAEW